MENTSRQQRTQRTLRKYRRFDAPPLRVPSVSSEVESFSSASSTS